MIDNTTILLIGAALGFATFLYNIATEEGVLYRPNTEGHQTFTLTIIKDYLIAPFLIGTTKFDTLWANFDGLTMIERWKLLQLNWIAMTILGLSIAATIILFKWIL